jgi:hypothetical protein
MRRGVLPFWGFCPMYYSLFIFHHSLFIKPFGFFALHHYRRLLRIRLQVVGLCPTPHKLFEKSLIKNFTKVVFCLAPRPNFCLAETLRALTAPR